MNSKDRKFFLVSNGNSNSNSNSDDNKEVDHDAHSGRKRTNNTRHFRLCSLELVAFV